LEIIMQTRRNLLKSAAGIAGAAFALSQSPTVAFAKAPLVQAQVPGYYRFKFGAFEITALSDGTLPLPMAKVYEGIEETKAADYLAEHFQPSPNETSVNAFLINSGERLVLVDAGTGNLMGPLLGKLLRNIEASGYRADQIDDVIMTHLHTDHSGGLSVDGKAVFKNALLHVNEREAEFWLGGKADPALANYVKEAEDAVAPYVAAGRFKTFADNASPVDGFGTILLPGHTPGHSGIVLESDGQKILFWGDISHGELLQFDRPDVTVEFDVDQPAAAATRAKAFADAADGKYLVAGAHHTFPGIGHVRRDDSNYDWVPLVYSANY
jgi:glyoxylase-like metal-dependent hydrolase (beta-lactamase superfamily II)